MMARVYPHLPMRLMRRGALPEWSEPLGWARVLPQEGLRSISKRDRNLPQIEARPQRHAGQAVEFGQNTK